MRMAEKQYIQLNAGSEPCCDLGMLHSQRYVYIKSGGREVCNGSTSLKPKMFDTVCQCYFSIPPYFLNK